MRNFVILLVMIVSITHIQAQKSSKFLAKLEASSTESTTKVVFTPNEKLLIPEIWNRVSEYRFECEFLRLAVEYKDHEYYLIEMDGNQRVLAQDVHYSVISDRIIQLTLKNSI